MPTYGYECTKCQEQFEVFQRITEPALTLHDGCGGELRRLMYPVGIVFKGAGFYVNDYGKNGSKAGKNGTEAPETKTETKSESTTETTPAPKAETKTETKAEPTPAAKS